MGQIAEKYSDKMWITPDNPRSENILDINNEIIKNIKTKNLEIFNNRGKALRLAIKSLMKDDILVVLGKGREDFQEVKGEKIDYSDIKIIESFIE